MVKVKLIGPRAAQWNIGKRFIQGESIVELTATEMKNHSDVIAETLDKVKKAKGYTEKELFDMKKDQQIKILKKLGIEEIPKYEKDRVAAILEAQ